MLWQYDGEKQVPHVLAWRTQVEDNHCSLIIIADVQ